MILQYVLPDGEQKEFELGRKAITIGRGADADVRLPDNLASRIHCGISYKDGNYFLRDCGSRNGTFVNDSSIEVYRINPGDRIRVGDMVLTVVASPRKGTVTVLRELKDEMAKGKGYHTILQEIIRDEKKPDDQ
ncbi:MAG: FHA domain-containing protein [Verrucomicrobia bacterium]|nr:FHA domain-containing protein [Verrucomicrobiota bacterium]MBU1736269.1 FHA domain-containing protein [Verrucomicrobiota bacterium]MBU1857667.1 FHA domain-containing protein [Verrucomicrobiota bacterium]